MPAKWDGYFFIWIDKIVFAFWFDNNEPVVMGFV
jgi:hypothetical protein